MIKLQKQLLALKHDEDGMAAVEFAIIAPVFLFMLMGSFDIGHSVYMRSVLDGAVQQAARDSALETGPVRTAEIDEKVTKTVKMLSNLAEVEFTRESYFQFNDVDRAEIFTDANVDGACNNGEIFEDENDNGSWDEDIGENGIGGPRDIVQYTVKVTYPGILSLGKFSRKGTAEINGAQQDVSFDFLGFSATRVMSATTVLQNQPYGDQAAAGAAVPGTCS